MKKTGNYQLNLWEKSDRIQMEDFNADNMKMEQALGAMQAEIEAARAAVPYVKLLDVTTTEDSQQADIDLSGLDLTQYQRLDIHVTPAATGPNYANAIFLQINGLNSGYYIGNVASSEIARGNVWTKEKGFCYLAYHLYLGPFVMASSTSLITQFNSSSNIVTQQVYPDTLGMLDIPPSQLESLRFVANLADRPLKAGMRIAIYGLKK